MAIKLSFQRKMDQLMGHSRFGEHLGSLNYSLALANVTFSTSIIWLHVCNSRNLNEPSEQVASWFEQNSQPFAGESAIAWVQAHWPELAQISTRQLSGADLILIRQRIKQIPTGIHVFICFCEKYYTLSPAA